MKSKNIILKLLFVGISLLLSGCATIVNDAMIPITASFSDGSSGECTFRNKRGLWASDMPTANGGVMVRRSDDALTYDCSTNDGRDAVGSVESEIEGEKIAASVVFFDLGITDAITDMHRTYQGNIVIPVASPPVASPDEILTGAAEADDNNSGNDTAVGVGGRLSELDDLREQGLISEEEYQAARQRALGI